MTQRRGLLFFHAFLLSLLVLIGAGLLGFTVQAEEALKTYTALDPVVCTPDLPGMVGYWPMDDGAGASTFVDLIDPDGLNHATCEEGKCPDSTTGKIGGAFNFVFVDDPVTPFGDEVNAPDFDGLDWAGDSSFSIETWVNIPDTFVCHPNNVFVGRRQGNISLWLGCGTDNKAVFSIRDNLATQSIATSVDPINDGLWHHVVGVRDGTTGETVVYVDGTVGTPVTQTFTGTFSTEEELNIGWFDTLPFYWLTGSLDEIAIYNRALTAEEITGHYSGGQGQTYCNDGPLIESVAAQASDEGTVASVTVTAVDPEGDDFTLGATGFPPDLVFTPATGEFSGTISYLAHVGVAPYVVTITATETEPDGAVGTGIFNWMVNDINRAPSVTNPGTRNSAEGDEIDLQIVASDPDTDNTLIFDAENLPPGLSINSATGVISGTISFDASATSPYTVKVIVTDDAAFPDHVAIPVETTFTWNVADTNQGPVLTNAEDRLNAEGDVVDFQVLATDPEGDNVTSYAADNLPPGLTINTTTGKISGTISYLAYTGVPYTVEISATDDGDPIETGTATLNWTVTDTNRSPVLTNPGTQDSLENQFINLQIVASDPDTDNNLTFGASNLPLGLDIDPLTGVISGTINNQASPDSPYAVEVTVTDDAPEPMEVSVTFTWNVAENDIEIFLPIVENGGLP